MHVKDKTVIHKSILLRVFRSSLSQKLC